jgi:hypothetical protein
MGSPFAGASAVDIGVVVLQLMAQRKIYIELKFK